MLISLQRRFGPAALAATLTALSLVAMPMASVAHGTDENPVAPADLSTTSIIHRLKMMGYTDIQVRHEGDASVDLQVKRNGATYALRASRKLLGPDSLISSDASQRVERALSPLAPPTSTSGSTTPTVVPR